MHIRRPLALKAWSNFCSIYAPRIHPRPLGISSSAVARILAPTNSVRLVLPHSRYASTSQEVVNSSRSLGTRLKNLLLGTVIGASLVLGYYYVTDTRAGIHQWVVVPSLRWIYDDAEEAHEAGTKALKALHKFGIHPRERGKPDDAGDLQVEVFGHILSNPIGTSAGIDKNAEIPTPLLAIGPAVIEVGGVTPYPQEGNPKPRVFRLPSQNALINRYGLNSEGAESIAMRLRQRVREYAYAMGFGLDEVAEKRVLDGEAGVPPGSLVKGKLMAVQVAKNKATPDDDIEAIKNDYVYCVTTLARYADLIIINVSSPNTPGLRDLQRVEPLTNILKGVVAAAKSIDRKSKPAVMVKVSPDEDSDQQVAGVCDAVWESGVDGVIVGNTTKRRPDPLPAGYTLSDQEAKLLLEQGGYSGPQLFERTVELVKKYRAMLDDGLRKLPAGKQAGTDRSQFPFSKPLPPSKTQREEIIAQKIQASIERDRANLKSPGEEEKKAPLFRLPDRNSLFSSGPAGQQVPAPSLSHYLHQLPPADSTSTTTNSTTSQRKVIFATGGITNGKQALEVLEAGASVAMVYTALVYGGVGTISRIKGEMREEMKGRR